MFDFGVTEILVIFVIALLVVGPKDLPGMLRTLGQYAGKARGMAREFQRSMDDAAREADLKEFSDLKSGFSDLNKSINPVHAAKDWMKEPETKDQAPKAGDPANAPLPVSEPKPDATPEPKPEPTALELAEQKARAEAERKRAVDQARRDQSASASAPKEQ